MPTSFGSKTGLMALAALAVAVFVAPAAQAIPIRYDFWVYVVDGPLAGTTDTGSFTYDSSSITPDTFNQAVGLLTGLNFTFNGTTYDAGDANTGWLGFDAAGKLVSFGFGNDCEAGACTVSPGSQSWAATPGNSMYNPYYSFTYSTPMFADLAYGNVRFRHHRRPRHAAFDDYTLAVVPEPGALGLFGFGLLLLGVAAARRQRYVSFPDP